MVIGIFTEMLNCDFTTKIFHLHSCGRAHWQAYTIAAFFTSCRNSVGEKSLVVITGLISHGIQTESSPCLLCYSGPLSFSFFWTTVLIKSSGHKVCQKTNSYLRTACLSGRGPFRHCWRAVTGLVAWGVGGVAFGKDTARGPWTYQRQTAISASVTYLWKHHLWRTLNNVHEGGLVRRYQLCLIQVWVNYGPEHPA